MIGLSTLLTSLPPRAFLMTILERGKHPPLNWLKFENYRLPPSRSASRKSDTQQEQFKTGGGEYEMMSALGIPIREFRKPLFRSQPLPWLTE